MNTSTASHRTTLLQSIDDFIVSRKAQRLAPGTVIFYHEWLKTFLKYSEEQGVTEPEQITSRVINGYIGWLSSAIVKNKQGQDVPRYNDGGCHAGYRALRSYVYWWDGDDDSHPNWINPYKNRKVMAPKVSKTVLPPVPIDSVQALLRACDTHNGLNGGDECFYGKRDKAILYTLLDTGARARELLALNVEDVNLMTGEVIINHGKGDRQRSVFIAKTARKAIREFIKVHPGKGSGLRKGEPTPLWVFRNGGAMGYDALHDMLNRRSVQANLPKVAHPHDFRRAFCIACIRAGMNLYIIQKLMGHADLQTIRRYAETISDDLRSAHALASPVETFLA